MTTTHPSQLVEGPLCNLSFANHVDLIGGSTGELQDLMQATLDQDSKFTLRIQSAYPQATLDQDSKFTLRIQSAYPQATLDQDSKFTLRIQSAYPQATLDQYVLNLFTAFSHVLSDYSTSLKLLSGITQQHSDNTLFQASFSLTQATLNLL